MPSVPELIGQSPFVQAAIDYLAAEHGIDAALVASAAEHAANGRAGRFFPLTIAEPAAGLSCTAASPEALDRAEPHVRLCLTAIAELLQRETELQESTAEILQLSDQLHFLFSLANKVKGITSLKEYCSIILQEIAQAINAEQAFILIKSRWDEQLEILYNLTAEQAMALQQDPVYEEAPRDRITIVTLTDGGSLLLAPIREKEGRVGFLAFVRPPASRFFTAYEKQFVSIIETIISPTIETIRLYDSLQDLYLNTVKALAAAIDAKDRHTHGHSFRVAKYSMAIGKKLELTDKELSDLEVAAYMHDLGKIGISEAILGKPGRLTPAEFSEIQKHPVYTDKILQPINLPDFIVEAAVHHHERLDGSGYPSGLRGEGIGLFARIIAVADVFDALTSDRPYRDAMPVETALKILCDGIDTKFDRQVVLALVAALQDEETGKALSDIYLILKFSDFQNLNQFLVELSRFLTPEQRHQTWASGYFQNQQR